MEVFDVVINYIYKYLTTVNTSTKIIMTDFQPLRCLLMCSLYSLITKMV